MIKVAFKDIVHYHKGICNICVSMIYEVPCSIDISFVEYMKSFGTPLYDLNTNKLIKIETQDKHYIQAKIDKEYIKFGMPKELEYTDLDQTTRKLEFEKALKSWLMSKLPIDII